jgi:hypothetical protein
VTNFVYTGVSCGAQTGNFGTGSGEGGTIQSTTHGTKGTISIVGNLQPATTGVYYNGIATNRWAGLSANGINLNTGGTPSANTISVNAGFHITLGSTPSASGANIFNYQSASSAATSGTTNLLNIATAPFQPTSGDAVYNVFSITNTINQTGTATGITRGVLIWPTLTSAANYRAIETIGKIKFNGLADVTTPDSLLAYEDGEIEKVATSVIAHGPTSNTYTPTTASPTNIDAVTPLGVKWFRIGRMVHVYGAVDIDATTTGTVTAFTMELPTGVFGGTFVNNYDASGVTNTTYSTGNESGVVFAIAGSALVELRFYAGSTASNRWRFSYSYVSD